MMAPVYSPLIPSQPAFASAGVPFSERYRDVYHAVQGPIAQADYVFLQGNGLPARWRGRERFTVCETGFGLGFNFLALWQAWRADPERPARLHVVSIEAHPFSREHMAELLAGKLDGDLRAMADTLIAKWPPLLPGLHRIDLEDGALTLTLAFGYALDVVPQLTAHVDAFFLDGFSPDRNPDMWSPPLMKALARLAAPGATAATWSSAGDVRRALAEAGFEVRKHPGFGYKRVMTVATYAPRYVPRHASRPPPMFADRHAVVVGAGIAGANVAHALALRGWRVTVVAPDGSVGGLPHAANLDPAPDANVECMPDAANVDPSPRTANVTTVPGADHPCAAPPLPNPGHLAAAMTPLVARDDNARARLTRAGALRAQVRWSAWIDGDIIARTGTLQLAKSISKEADLRATVAALGFPEDWVRAVEVEEASALAGTRVARGGLYFPDGLRVRPQALCERLLMHPGITRVVGAVDRLQAAGQVNAVDATAGQSTAGKSTAGNSAADDSTAVDANATEATVADAEDVHAGDAEPVNPRHVSDVTQSSTLPCDNLRHWNVLDATGHVLATAELIVIANSIGAPALLQRSSTEPPASARFYDQLAVAGQITTLPITTVSATYPAPSTESWGPPPRCIVAGEGYVLPPTAHQCVTGSTYVYDAAVPSATWEGTDANLARAAHLLPSVASVTRGVPGLGGWAGWRAVVPGRLPVIGEWPGASGVWVAGGYASRGMTWAALAGDLIAAAVDGEPLMLERELLHLIAWR